MKRHPREERKEAEEEKNATNLSTHMRAYMHFSWQASAHGMSVLLALNSSVIPPLTAVWHT